MGRPVIIYGVEELDNHSFEDDSPATDPPTDWDDSPSVNGINAVDAGHYISPGIGFPSVQSLRQNVTSSGGGNKAVLRQRVAAADAVGFLQQYGSGEIAAVAHLKPVDATASGNASIAIEQYSGGTATPGSGSLESSTARTITAVGDGTWELRAAVDDIDSATDWIDVLLKYELGSYGASSHAYWDRVYVGALLDMADKGFRTIADRIKPGIAINEGDKVVEVVRYTATRTELDLEVRNVLLNQGTIDADLKRFMQWHETEFVGRVVIWVDRDRYHNSDHHFVNAYPDDRIRVRMPPGVERRRYNIRLNVNGELP